MTDTTSQDDKSFLHDLKFELHATEHGAAGTCSIDEMLLVPGSDHAYLGLLATIADVAMGSPVSDVAGKRLVGLTVDLVMRGFAPVGVGEYHVDARVVKRGRTLAVAETTISGGSKVVGHSIATFMPIEIDGPLAMPMPKGRDRVGDGELDAPFAESLGIVVESPGVATVARRPYTLQPAGTIQGGVICMLAEIAALSVLDAPIIDLDVRYLAQVKVGPARAVAEPINDRIARVVITDAGSGNPRPTAYCIARTA